MKKRLEAELISLAHRILKLKNISELKQLHSETQKLYETLSVLKFVEENINVIQPKIDVVAVEVKLENIIFKSDNTPTIENEINQVEKVISVFENDNIVSETINQNPEIKHFSSEREISNEKISTNEKIEVVDEEPVIRAVISSIQDEVIEEEIMIPDDQLKKEELKFSKKPEPVQISFDEFKFIEPVFEKKLDIKEEKIIILNEKLSKGINIGLNDKIAFVKHLFAESHEDYNRVLSQINTFDTYFDTVTFINEIVKPDYNNWENKEEYVLRFLESVEKKFV